MYKKVHKSYGVIGLLIIHNMLADNLIDKKMVSQGDDMKFALVSFNEEKIRYAFYLMLTNILVCFRTL